MASAIKLTSSRLCFQLNEARIDTVDGDLKRCLTLSTADLRFADNLVKSLIEESGDPFLDNTGDFLCSFIFSALS